VVRRRQSDGDGSPYALTLAFDHQIYHMLIRRRDNGKYSLGTDRPDQHVCSILIFLSVWVPIIAYLTASSHTTLCKFCCCRRPRFCCWAYWYLFACYLLIYCPCLIVYSCSVLTLWVTWVYITKRTCRPVKICYSSLNLRSFCYRYLWETRTRLL